MSHKHINIQKRLGRLRHQHPLALVDVFKTALCTLKYRFIFRCAGAGTIVGFNTQIANFSNVTIGKGCFLQDNVYMRAGAKGSITLGKHVAVNSFAKLFGHGGITVGDNSQIGPGVIMTTTTHNFENDLQTSFHPICIGEWSWIGANATILSGVTIGKHSVIGAGSLVNKDVPDYAVVVGSPARVIKMIEQPEQPEQPLPVQGATESVAIREAS